MKSRLLALFLLLFAGCADNHLLTPTAQQQIEYQLSLPDALNKMIKDKIITNAFVEKEIKNPKTIIVPVDTLSSILAFKRYIENNYNLVVEVNNYLSSNTTLVIRVKKENFFKE